jgi:hypothetical protein
VPPDMGCSFCDSFRYLVLDILPGVPTPDDHAARLDRIHVLCAAADEAHAEAQRIYREQTAKAKEAKSAVLVAPHLPDLVSE